MATNYTIRYTLLDALRGVAAIGVMLYHIQTRLNAPAFIPHGYLAVDFFFVLSGFVVAHAYSERMNYLLLSQFFELRLKRFLPMSVLGVLVGTVYLLLRWRVQPSLSDTLPQLLAASGINLFLVPKFWVARATGTDMYPADGVLWTLFFELGINLVWAAWFVRCRNVILVAVAVVGGLTLGVVAVHHGSTDIGFRWNTFIGGIGRVTFGFFAGVLLWRLRSQSRLPPIAGWLCAGALVWLLCLPKFPWWADVAIITLIFPALVYFAAAAASDKVPKAFRLLGDISYPLYAVHMPILIIVSGFQKWKYPGAHIGYAFYLLAFPVIGLAFLAERFYDVPVRQWLAKPHQQRGTDPHISSTPMDTGARMFWAEPEVSKREVAGTLARDLRSTGPAEQVPYH